MPITKIILKRRQRLVYSLLEDLKIGIAEEMAPPDPPASPPINAELASVNMAADIYAIGDIHGNLDLLKRLLEKIQPNLARNQLVFMGDYIDWGQVSRGLIDEGA
jgi:hypothetical protein